MGVMRRGQNTKRLILWFATLAFLWTSAPVNASFPILSEVMASSQNHAQASSGCDHHNEATREETEDGDEDCGDDATVSCTTCKCTGPAAFAFIGSAPTAKFNSYQTSGATRIVKPALDPPRT